MLQLVAGPTGTVLFLDTAPTFSAATAQVSFAVPAVATSVHGSTPVLLSRYQFNSSVCRYHGSTPVLLSWYQFNSSVCCRPSVLPQLQHLFQCMLSLPTSMLLLYKCCKCYNLRWSSIGLYQGQASEYEVNAPAITVKPVPTSSQYLDQ